MLLLWLLRILQRLTLIFMVEVGLGLRLGFGVSFQMRSPNLSLFGLVFLISHIQILVVNFILVETDHMDRSRILHMKLNLI
jgi:hypothetical protein